VAPFYAHKPLLAYFPQISRSKLYTKASPLNSAVKKIPKTLRRTTLFGSRALRNTLALLLITMLILPCFGQSMPRLDIRLQGEFSFNDIVNETENQLDISIHLPLEISSKSTRSYNQIITLQQLCDAVVQQYAQQNIPVIYEYDKKELIFQRSDEPKTIKKIVPVAPDNHVAAPKKILPISEPPVQNETPIMPHWANRETLRESPTSPSKVVAQNSTQNHTTITNLEDPFELNLPRKQVFSPSNPPVSSQHNSSRESPQIFPNVTPPSSSQKNLSTGKFSITPYPDDAVAFINDAPSIVPGTNKESYIEWQTRMQGALQNQNVSVLKNEKLELERRMRWLEKQLP